MIIDGKNIPGFPKDTAWALLESQQTGIRYFVAGMQTAEYFDTYRIGVHSMPPSLPQPARDGSIPPSLDTALLPLLLHGDEGKTLASEFHLLGTHVRDSAEFNYSNALRSRLQKPVIHYSLNDGLPTAAITAHFIDLSEVVTTSGRLKSHRAVVGESRSNRMGVLGSLGYLGMYFPEFDFDTVRDRLYRVAPSGTLRLKIALHE
jgi:hypothetical protein